MVKIGQPMPSTDAPEQRHATIKAESHEILDALAKMPVGMILPVETESRAYAQKLCIRVYSAKRSARKNGSSAWRRYTAYQRGSTVYFQRVKEDA